MRLINAESPQNRIYVSDLVIEEMKKIPTVDIDRPTRSQFKRMAVQLGYKEVVYCKDCEFAEPYEREDGEIGYYCHNEKHSFVYGATWERKFNPVKEKNDFCSDGERRTDE